MTPTAGGPTLIAPGDGRLAGAPLPPPCRSMCRRGPWLRVRTIPSSTRRLPRRRSPIRWPSCAGPRPPRARPGRTGSATPSRCCGGRRRAERTDDGSALVALVVGAGRGRRLGCVVGRCRPARVTDVGRRRGRLVAAGRHQPWRRRRRPPPRAPASGSTAPGAAGDLIVQAAGRRGPSGRLPPRRRGEGRRPDPAGRRPRRRCRRRSGQPRVAAGRRRAGLGAAPGRGRPPGGGRRGRVGRLRVFDRVAPGRPRSSISTPPPPRSSRPSPASARPPRRPSSTTASATARSARWTTSPMCAASATPSWPSSASWCGCDRLCGDRRHRGGRAGGPGLSDRAMVGLAAAAALGAWVPVPIPVWPAAAVAVAGARPAAARSCSSPRWPCSPRPCRRRPGSASGPWPRAAGPARHPGHRSRRARRSDPRRGAGPRAPLRRVGPGPGRRGPLRAGRRPGRRASTATSPLDRAATTGPHDATWSGGSRPRPCGRPATATRSIGWPTPCGPRCCGGRPALPIGSAGAVRRLRPRRRSGAVGRGGRRLQGRRAHPPARRVGRERRLRAGRGHAAAASPGPAVAVGRDAGASSASSG